MSSTIKLNILAWLLVLAKVIGLGMAILLIMFGLIAGYEYSQLFDPHGYVDLVIKYAMDGFIYLSLIASGSFALWLTGLLFVEIKNDVLEDLNNKVTGNNYE